jgi:DNA-binding NtrC family response regulator
MKPLRPNTMKPAQSSERLQQRRVLVVDDEKRIADTLIAILRLKDYQAEAAYNGPSGIEMYRRLQPALVISDVVMPGMNGIEMAIALQQEFSKCRVLLFSGQGATSEILERARSQGYDFEVLAKPVHPDHLLERVTQMIGPGHTA